LTPTPFRSAKKNWNIDELFRQLFQLSNLPAEMAPNSHRRILPSQVLYLHSHLAYDSH